MIQVDFCFSYTDQHQGAAKEEHHHKVGAAVAEGALLQHPAIAICEDEIEEEAETDLPKIEERGDEPPQLVALDDCRGIVVQLEGRDELKVLKEETQGENK